MGCADFLIQFLHGNQIRCIAEMTRRCLADFLQQTALPKLEARMLAERATAWTRSQLITRDDEELSESVWATLQAWVQRREQGEPLAYILGEREFYGRRFVVNSDVLIPRPETEHLVDEVLARLPQSGKVWDLGTGSGAIAVTLACERTDCEVFASDISDKALAVAQNNAEQWQVKVHFAQGSWFDVLPSAPHLRTRFDVIVSNPPYIERGDEHLLQGDLRFEPQHALTDFADGLTCIRILASQAMSFVLPQGYLLVEHGYNQGADVRAIFQQFGWQNVQTLPDLAGLDRITVGQCLSFG